MMDRDDPRAVHCSKDDTVSAKMYAKEKVQPLNRKQHAKELPPMTPNLFVNNEISFNDLFGHDRPAPKKLPPASRLISDPTVIHFQPQHHSAKPRRSSLQTYSQSSKHSLLRGETKRKSLTSIELLPQSRVTFRDHVDIVSITSLKDSPDDVRRKLWISDDELDLSIRQAKKLEMKKDRMKFIDSLLEKEVGRRGKVHSSSSSPEDDSSSISAEEEEGSMDFTDLTVVVGNKSEKEELSAETVVEDIRELTLA